MCTIEIQKGLSAPFPSTDIEFRVCRVSQRTKKANVLAYITARGIMRRLDEVFGIDGWRDEYEVLDSGVKCRLSVRLDDAWITKEVVANLYIVTREDTPKRCMNYCAVNQFCHYYRDVLALPIPKTA